MQLLNLLVGLVGAGFVFFLGGSRDAKTAAKTNSNCMTLKPKSGETGSDEYVNCLWTLEQLVTKLMDDKEINVKKCSSDTTYPDMVAWCPLWVWWHPTQVMVTNPDWVAGISGKKDIATIETMRNKNPDPEKRKSALKTIGQTQPGSNSRTNSDGSPKLLRRAISKTKNPDGEPVKSESDRSKITKAVAGDEFVD